MLYSLIMKKLVSVVFLVVFLVVFVAPLGHADEYNSALKAARSEHKPLLLYFFSKTCYYCSLMDKDTLSDKDVSAMLKRDFVFLRIDTDKSDELSTLYRIEGTPSSWFLDPTENASSKLRDTSRSRSTKRCSNT